LLLLVVSHDEPKEFSRAVENLIADLRRIPGIPRSTDASGEILHPR